MWALSKLAAPGERDEALLDAVAGAMLPALPDFNAQNVANTVRSFLRTLFTSLLDAACTSARRQAQLILLLCQVKTRIIAMFTALNVCVDTHPRICLF